MTTLEFLKNETKSFSTKKTANNSHKLLVGALALVLVVGMTTPAYAIVVDTFGTGPVALSAGPAGTDTVTNVGLPSSETIGDTRIVFITHDSGGLSISANANPNPGVVSFSANSLTRGTMDLTYMGVGGVGLLGIDLTDGGTADRIVVTFLAADFGSDVTVSITDTSGDTVSETIMANGGAESLDFLYANMAGTGDATTPADADKIVVTIEGLDMGDYTIDLITIPQMRVGGTVGSMDTATLLVAGAQANMGLWSLALVGVVGAGAAIIYKTKSKKTEQ